MGAARKTDAGLAQVGSGDPRVVAHPSYREIPKSLFPLGTTEAQAEYDALARMLFDAGRFAAGPHRILSSYAMQFDTITCAAAAGKQIRGSWFAQLDKARKELGLDELDRPIAAPAGASVNRYARVGFANRR